jgi:hypothetical protein
MPDSTSANAPIAIRIMGLWVRRADALLAHQGTSNAESAVLTAHGRRARDELDLRSALGTLAQQRRD